MYRFLDLLIASRLGTLQLARGDAQRATGHWLIYV